MGAEAAEIAIERAGIEKEDIDFIIFAQAEGEWFFVDEGQTLPKPLRYWKHIHKVKKQTEKQTFIIDDIAFSSNNYLLDILLYPFLYMQFALRKPAYRKYFNKL